MKKHKMATLKYVLKYTPIGAGVDLFYSSTSILNNASRFNTAFDATVIGVMNRFIDAYHNEAVVMCVELQENDTVLPSRDVKDQPLPPAH